ncbi:MAG: aminotransferase class III-fold pyridoxal phosphate-dependent enzyme [Vicinamibacterales bacterium]
MRAFHLDAAYERAEGDHLVQRRGLETLRVLDLVGGFGTNLVGHHNPDVLAELRRLIDAKIPFSAQLSARPIAASLERRLRARLGAYRVVFTNSGTETVEAALKHAHLERPRQVFWGVRGSFHGKTLGSIQLTYAHRKPFEGLGPRVRFLDPWDRSQWAKYESEVEQVSAAIVEPILGEGGVIPLPAEFLGWLGAACRQSGIPLIADEIQTGLGRTGTFLACEATGLDPDYICLAKGLGGGIAKLGALLVREDRFIEAFSWLHTSTFAGDEIGCGIASRVLEILERDAVPARCEALGAYLLGRLRRLQDRYPDEIADVRGRGLLVGIELGDARGAGSNVLRAIAAHDLIGVMASSYLLNRHAIRVAPCLGHPATLRVEPSAYVERSELDRFVDALDMLCHAVRAQDVPHLVGHLIDRPRAASAARPEFRHLHREAPATSRRVAFIAHAIGPADLRSWDPSLASFDTDELDTLTRAAAGFLGPVVYNEFHVHAPEGAPVHLSLIGLFYTSWQLFDAYRARRHEHALGQIEQALTLARDRGCTVAGLGGFHSIVASNGKRLQTPGIGLTTGNALTVGMGIRALTRAASLAGIELESAALAVVGATGNIAQAYALSMAPAVRRLVLVTRPGCTGRCRTLAARLRDVAPCTELHVTDSLDVLRTCPLIVSASNAPEPVVYLRHLGPHPTVICDVSLPSDVAEEVTAGRGDVVVLNGGVVRLPCDPDLVIPGLPLAPGHVYACLAETLLMGLDGITSHGSYGPLTPECVEWALALADKHGFALAESLTSSLLTA